MHEMPMKWQDKMAKLLNEYDETFPNKLDIGSRVQITHKGNLIKTPKWLINYRHPNYKEIKKLRSCDEKEEKV